MPLAILAERFELSAFELDVLFIAVVVDIEPRYEALFGYVQNDVARKRPTVDLVLTLLSGPVADRFELMRCVDMPRAEFSCFVLIKTVMHAQRNLAAL